MRKLAKSDKLNRTYVFLAFRTKLTRLRAKFNASFGLPVSYMALIIFDKQSKKYKFYGLKWGKPTVQEMSWDKINKKNFILVNTKYRTSDLHCGWKRRLLKEKARCFDRLWARNRCVKCLRPVLDNLHKKWHYRLGDVFASIYLKRRYKNDR